MPALEADTVPTVTTPNPRNDATMFQIFQNVQFNVVQHKKYIKEMTKLYKKIPQNAFRESFKNALHYLFTFGDTSANVDRVIQFVATFCTSLDDEEEFLLYIFEIIFDCQCVSGQSVRYRASQLLAAVLGALGEDASLDDDLCDKLLASQMERLQDTRGAVRCRAAIALQRLQNPMENDDEVTRAYRFHMSCDPSSSVRRAIVMAIAKCTRNVTFVLERLCDVDEAVRRAAFVYISTINVTQLRVRQRVFTLKVGLTERSVRVRRVVEEILIPGWLSTFKGNIIDLLKAIRLDNAHDAKDSQEVAGKLLESLFKRLPISELLEWLPTDKSLRLIPAERLNKETTWYWRHLAEHLQRIDDDETLETVLPDLVVLTGYIKAIVESPCPPEATDPVGFSTRQYVLHELASLLHVYDASDHAGRSALQELITDVLTGEYGPLSAHVIRAFVTSLEMLIPEVSRRIEVVAGVISALREPPEVEAPPPPPPAVSVEDGEVKLQRARLRVSLNVAMEAQEEAVQDQNYALAEECKAKVRDIQKKLEELNVQPAPPPPPPPQPSIREKISDAATLTKCLNILNCALDTPHLTAITPMLRMIYNELEVEILQNPDILETALETVALYGMLDKEFAKENKAFFFANLIDTSNELIVTTVLRSLVDLLCVHGAKVFEDDDVTEDRLIKKKRATYDPMDDEGNISSLSMSQNHSTVIELLLKIMDSTSNTYRLIIAEGLCRLLHLGHLESPAILSRLLLLWFNPATVEEDMLRQVIGVFFQSFASSVDGAQEQIQRATLPTLRALANAPSSSPVSEIDQEAVVRFIVSLTRVSHELTDSGGAMAAALCHALARAPAAPAAALVCRALALLPPPRAAQHAAALAGLLRDVQANVADKQSSRHLTRYLGALEAVERASINKMSNAGATEGSMQIEDTLTGLSRATTSLPQPIARSTQVHIDETVEEEPEIDETSPPEAISKISHEPHRSSNDSEPTSPKLARLSDEPGSRPSDTDARSDAQARNEDGSDSSDVSPVKKAKVAKGKKKKLSINKKDSDASAKETKGGKEKSKEKKMTSQEENGGGFKRRRSQRSLEDLDRAKPKPGKSQPARPSTPPSPAFDLDSSNVTTRRSTRPLQSSSSSDSTGSGKKAAVKPSRQSIEAESTSPQSSPLQPSRTSPRHQPPRESSKTKEPKKPKIQESKKNPKSQGSKKNTKSQGSQKNPKSQDVRKSPRSSQGSVCSMFEDSADETELHTIVYDQEMAQSLLNDSSELMQSRDASRASLTVPETPEGSEDPLQPSRTSPRNQPPRESSKTKESKKPKSQESKKNPKSQASKKNPKSQGSQKNPKTQDVRKSPRSSQGSVCSMFEDSADETELHTIVYDQEMAQSLLNDSSELMQSRDASRASLTVPETPEGSEESESEAEVIPVKTKGKGKGKKK